MKKRKLKKTIKKLGQDNDMLINDIYKILDNDIETIAQWTIIKRMNDTLMLIDECYDVDQPQGIIPDDVLKYDLRSKEDIIYKK